MDQVFSLNEIDAVAAELWEQTGTGVVLAFHGAMGAGKTTFIHALCQYLGVTDKVSSPTFSIINEYHCPGGVLYHMDLYRLNGEEEALRAGVEEALYSGATCLVEWPGKAPGLFPANTVHVYLDLAGDNKRRLHIRRN